MVLEVLKFPDSRLRKKSLPVEEVTEELRVFANDMIETMYSCGGIGLSAPQVNRLIRLLVMDTRLKGEAKERYAEAEGKGMTELEKGIEQPFVIFNPTVVFEKGDITFNEGCLSLPGYYDFVSRFSHIKVEGLNIKGEKFLVEVDGLMAICIQHEIDHLDGKLFIDRLSPIRSLRIKKKIKKFGYSSKKSEDSSEEIVASTDTNGGNSSTEENLNQSKNKSSSSPFLLDGLEKLNGRTRREM